ncbi:Bcr/CflA family efflux MFS transporter [Demequina sp. NBRC 110051]|uniref:Bcr/CflA family efflux MFS transporter n=1 Tax=Demequina sp. NBRC 110051 TaxID=1570340 RepID=UPI001356332D|nr:Bcr/CflA family efflux MFS transporter [Demequina sp. NBRC 110051]
MNTGAGGGSPRPALVALLATLSMFGPLSMDLYLPSLPRLAQDLEVSEQTAQLTMSVCFVALGLGQLVYGPVSDRYGRRGPLLAATCGYVAMSAACALAPTAGALIVARTLQGLCGAGGVVIAMAIARDLASGAALARLLALLASITTLAPVVAPVVGGQLARIMDWRGIFWVLTAIGVAIVAAVLVVGVPEASTGAARREHPAHAARALATDPVFRSVLLVIAAASVGLFAYLNMSTFAFQTDLGASETQFSIAFATIAAAGLAGAQATRVAVTHTGPGRLFVAAVCVWAGVAVTLALVTRVGIGLPLIVAALALCQACLATMLATGPSLALGAHAPRAATAASLLGVAGTIPGPLLVPLFSRAHVSAASMTTAIAVAAATAALLALMLVAPALRRAAAAQAPASPDLAIEQER